MELHRQGGSFACIFMELHAKAPFPCTQRGASALYACMQWDRMTPHSMRHRDGTKGTPASCACPKKKRICFLIYDRYLAWGWGAAQFFMESPRTFRRAGSVSSWGAGRRLAQPKHMRPACKGVMSVIQESFRHARCHVGVIRVSCRHICGVVVAHLDLSRGHSGEIWTHRGVILDQPRGRLGTTCGHLRYTWGRPGWPLK